MTAGDDCSGLGHLVRSAAQYAGYCLRRQAGGKAGDVEGEDGLGAHRVDIADCVCSGNGAVFVRVIDKRGEKVNSEDNSLIVVELIDGGVVGSFQADEEIGVVAILEGGEVAKDLRKHLGTCLGSTAGA